MALDPAIGDQLTTNALIGAQRSADLTGFIGQNAAQALAVVQTTTVQVNANTTDDPATYAALQTATRAPSGTTA